MTDKVAASNRARTAWFPLLLKRNGVMELRVGWKDCKGRLSFFTTDGKAKSRALKEPWAAVERVVYVEKAEPDKVDVFKFTNKQKKKISFFTNTLDPSLWKICNFTTKWMELRASGEEQKLAHFLTALTSSKFFIHKCDPEEFEIDGTRKSMVDSLGKDREEFIEFLEAAKEDAMEVKTLSEAITMCGGGNEDRKRKSNTHDGTSNKLSKAQEVEKLKEVEIKDEDGLEVQAKKNIKARKEISIYNLSLSPVLQKEVPVNPIRVQKLAMSMKQIFDPAQMVLTVFPVSGTENEDYWVVAGQHRFSAVQQLDREGCLDQLPTLREKKILCFVIDSNSETLQSYVQKRNGKIQADVQDLNTHDLLFTVASFRERMSQEKTVETIGRLCRLLGIPGDDISILQRISSWPRQSITELADIVRQYISFKTLDVREQKRGLSQILSKGRPLPMSKTLFRKMGKLSSLKVSNLKVSVMKNLISLDKGVDLCLKEQEREKTATLIAEILKETPEIVSKEYGDYFSNDVLDSYNGAIYRKSGRGILSSNEKGVDLNRYCEDIVLSSQLNAEPKVSLWDTEHYKVMLSTDIDLLLMTCDFREGVNKIIEALEIAKENSSEGVILIFSEEEGVADIKKHLEARGSKSVKNIFFKREKAMKAEGYDQNVYYGLVSGKVLFPSISILNGSIKTDLKTVVSKMTPRNGRIAAVFSAKFVPCCIVHDEKTRHIDYFMDAHDIKNMEAMLKKVNVKEFGQNIGESMDVEEIGGASIAGVADMEEEKANLESV